MAALCPKKGAPCLPVRRAEAGAALSAREKRRRRARGAHRARPRAGKGGMPMKCPKCGVEMRVKAAYRVRGDTSPATPTRLVLAQAFFCRSRACENFGRQVCEKEHEVPLEPAPQAGGAGGG